MLKLVPSVSTLIKYLLNRIPRPVLIRLSYGVRPLIALCLRGRKYTDPIDGKRFKTFLPYGYENPRKNVLSPSTLSLERHRLLWLYLKNETDFFTQPSKVLHVAPEQAFYHRFKKYSHLDYTTVDLHSPLADVKVDLCHLPFNDNTFDVIFCNHVLEHIPNDIQALHQLYRVLKPGGWGIFQVPQDLKRDKTFEDNTITDKKERARIFGQYDHVRIYGRDYFDRLSSVGFTVEAVPYTQTLSQQHIQTYCLAPGEILPLVKKAS